MTSNNPASTAASKRGEDPATSAADRVLSAAGDVSTMARGVADDVAGRLPDAAAATRNALVEAERQISAGSDEMVTVGTVFAFGFALGLLVGGANRLLVIGALVPAAALGISLADRMQPRRSSAAR